jgi:hypothetical protein
MLQQQLKRRGRGDSNNVLESAGLERSLEYGVVQRCRRPIDSLMNIDDVTFRVLREYPNFFLGRIVPQHIRRTKHNKGLLLPVGGAV